MGGTVVRDFPHHMRVDRRHGRIDDLELHPGIAIPEQDFENPAETKRRIRHALRRGTPEHENANGPGGFGGEETRYGVAGDGGGKNRHPN